MTSAHARWLLTHRPSQSQGQTDRAKKLSADRFKYRNLSIPTMLRMSVLVDSGPRDWRRRTFDVTLARVGFAPRDRVYAWSWGRL